MGACASKNDLPQRHNTAVEAALKRRREQLADRRSNTVDASVGASRRNAPARCVGQAALPGGCQPGLAMPHTACPGSGVSLCRGLERGRLADRARPVYPPTRCGTYAAGGDIHTRGQRTGFFDKNRNQPGAHAPSVVCCHGQYRLLLVGLLSCRAASHCDPLVLVQANGG